MKWNSESVTLSLSHQPPFPQLTLICIDRERDVYESGLSHTHTQTVTQLLLSRTLSLPPPSLKISLPHTLPPPPPHTLPPSPSLACSPPPPSPLNSPMSAFYPTNSIPFLHLTTDYRSKPSSIKHSRNRLLRTVPLNQTLPQQRKPSAMK